MATACLKEKTEPIPVQETNSACDTLFVEVRNNDTIQPSPYLSTYPGSWWNYDNGSLVLCFDWIEVPVYTNTWDDEGCLTVTTTYTFLPRTSTDTIYGDSRLKNYEKAKTTRFERLVCEFEESGEETYLPFIQQEFPYAYEIFNSWSCDSVFDSKIIDGTYYEDVRMIRIRRGIRYFHTLDENGSEFYFYFARDVGLIQQVFAYELFLPYEDMVTYRLINHTIAPH